MASAEPSSSKSEVDDLLAQRGMTWRALAAETRVSAGHLHHALTGAQGKRPTKDLLEKVAGALGVPPSHFGEYRALVVCDAVHGDPKLRDRIYRQLQRS